MMGKVKTINYKKVIALCFCGLFLLINYSVRAQISGDYRTRYTDGSNRGWSTVTNWEKYNGSAWATATAIPNSSTTNVTVRAGSKLIINGNYSCKNLTINGLVQFFWGTSNTDPAKTLTVYGNVTLSGNADFQTNAANDAYRNYIHMLAIYGSILNNANSGHGILFNDYSSSTEWSCVQVRFKGPGKSTWEGTGENDLGGLSISKDNATDTVEIKPSTLLGWGSNNLDGNGFFFYSISGFEHKGILKFGGTFPMITRLGIQTTGPGYTRQLPQISSEANGSNFQLIIDNPNFGITGYGSTKCYGSWLLNKETLILEIVLIIFYNS